MLRHGRHGRHAWYGTHICQLFNIINGLMCCVGLNGFDLMMSGILLYIIVHGMGGMPGIALGLVHLWYNSANVDASVSGIEEILVSLSLPPSLPRSLSLSLALSPLLLCVCVCSSRWPFLAPFVCIRVRERVHATEMLTIRFSQFVWFDYEDFMLLLFGLSHKGMGMGGMPGMIVFWLVFSLDANF